MLQRFFRQFSGPQGLLGRIAGRLMARLNGPLNDWIVELLELAPASRVLEVGCGPGLDVERVAARRLVGGDHSALVQRQASRRFDRSRHGMSDARLAQVLAAVQAAGFRDLKTLRREVRGEQISTVLARA